MSPPLPNLSIKPDWWHGHLSHLRDVYQYHLEVVLVEVCSCKYSSNISYINYISQKASVVRWKHGNLWEWGVISGADCYKIKPVTFSIYQAISFNNSLSVSSETEKWYTSYILEIAIYLSRVQRIKSIAGWFCAIDFTIFKVSEMHRA